MNEALRQIEIIHRYISQPGPGIVTNIPRVLKFEAESALATLRSLLESDAGEDEKKIKAAIAVAAFTEKRVLKELRGEFERMGNVFEICQSIYDEIDQRLAALKAGKGKDGKD